MLSNNVFIENKHRIKEVIIIVMILNILVYFVLGILGENKV